MIKSPQLYIDLSSSTQSHVPALCLKDENKEASWTYQKIPNAGVDESYIIMDGLENKVAVFKPSSKDETSCKRGIRSCDNPIKEHIASKLDYDNFSKVPLTIIDRLNLDPTGIVSGPCNDKHDRIGSLQAFQSSSGSAEDFGFSLFKTKDVHRICVIDIRLVNLDRHLGNILVSEENGLVPIDHGCILPSFKELSDVYFEWASWPQVTEPLDTETIEYIMKLDGLKDCEEVLEMGIRKEEALTLLFATVFLQHCVKKGCTFGEMGSFMQRSGDMESPSDFEKVMNIAGNQFQYKDSEPWNRQKAKEFAQVFEANLILYMNEKL